MATVHVLPVDDLIEHDDEGDGCPCGVTAEPVKDDETGAVGWLITHHSLDRREQYEGGPDGRGLMKRNDCDTDPESNAGEPVDGDGWGAPGTPAAYDRLVAERDRLIAEGVPPDELVVPRPEGMVDAELDKS